MAQFTSELAARIFAAALMLRGREVTRITEGRLWTVYYN